MVIIIEITIDKTGRKIKNLQNIITTLTVNAQAYSRQKQGI
jgi:hypothetical protein